MCGGDQMSMGLITCQNDYLCAEVKDTTMYQRIDCNDLRSYLWDNDLY